MRLLVRLGVRINLSLGFSRIVEEAPDRSDMICFASYSTLSPVNLIPGSENMLLKRKDNSSQVPHRCLRVRLCYHTISTSEFRNINLLPFRLGGATTFKKVALLKKIAHVDTEFPYLLGPTNPCPIAVHMEPFSTSVFKVLI